MIKNIALLVMLSLGAVACADKAAPTETTTYDATLDGEDAKADGPAASAKCGNGRKDPGERCDDKNRRSGDGCSYRCKIERGWQCSDFPSYCYGICGDGLVRGEEECDDGNQETGDGCDDQCETEI